MTGSALDESARLRRQFQPFSEPKRGDDVLVGGPNELMAKCNHPMVSEVVITEFRNYCQGMITEQTLGSTIHEVENMRLGFHYDTVRHLYDEVRHSSLGVDPTGLSTQRSLHE